MRLISFSELQQVRSAPFLSRISQKYHSFPLYLEEVIRQIPYSLKRHAAEATTVDPQLVIGTVGPRPDFDGDLIPRDRSLRDDWTRACEILGSSDQHGEGEPVELVELGGQYFVRSGISLVAAARVHLVKALPASVERYETPVRLPHRFDRRRIPVLRAKIEFQEETKAFDYIPQEQFQVAKSSTYRTLADSILDRRSGTSLFPARNASSKPPRPTREAILRWNESVYATIIRYITESCLALDMEDCYDADIFAAVLRHWRHAPPYTSLSESFAGFAEQVRARNAVVRQLRSLLPGETGRMRFVRVSRLDQFIPDAVLPMGSDRWYRYLTDQLRSLHADVLRRRLGRQPNMREVVTTWYNELLSPVFRIFQERANDHSFPRTYVDWIDRSSIVEHALASPTNGTRKKVQDSFLSHVQSL